VENITSDVYKLKHQECEQKKLELIESCYSVTCKSGGNVLLWTVVPDSTADSSIMEFQNIGVQQMEWDKFNRLSSYAKAFTKSKGSSLEKPQPFMDLFILLWSGDWKKQLQQLNEAIERDYKKKSKHKHSVRQIKAVSANGFFVFLGIIIISGAVCKGGKSLFEKDSERLKDGIYRLSPVIDLSPYMSMRQFEDIKSYFPQAFADFDKAIQGKLIMILGTCFQSLLLHLMITEQK
jgi:hypothetical protein